ncbi:hypothetical protein DFJ74DRAFT_240479 [Hyaloraphidium curvatum]|nr:hypothetical protein DFJ74DRAFT_240479 [Hyaloraphidium curvatum]
MPSSRRVSDDLIEGSILSAGNGWTWNLQHDFNLASYKDGQPKSRLCGSDSACALPRGADLSACAVFGNHVRPNPPNVRWMKFTPTALELFGAGPDGSPFLLLKAIYAFGAPMASMDMDDGGCVRFRSHGPSPLGGVGNIMYSMRQDAVGHEPPEVEFFGVEVLADIGPIPFLGGLISVGGLLFVTDAGQSSLFCAGDRSLGSLNPAQGAFDCGGRFVINGKIDGGSSVTIAARRDVEITDKIDGGSRVRIVAKGGGVRIGGKIDGPRTDVRIFSRGNVDVLGKIDGTCTVEFVAEGDVFVHGKIDGRAKVRFKANSFTPLDKTDGCAEVINIGNDTRHTVADYFR